MLRLLEALNPMRRRLRVMAARLWGSWARSLPAARDLARLERLCEIDLDNQFVPDALLRLAALLAPQDAGPAAARLKLSNAQAARLTAMLDGPDKIASHLSAKDVRLLLYGIGPAAFEDRVRLKWAAAPRSQPAIQWRMLLAMAASWERPRFPLSGGDVMAAGVPEGSRRGTHPGRAAGRGMGGGGFCHRGSGAARKAGGAGRVERLEGLMFHKLDSLSLPGDPERPNEDALWRQRSRSGSDGRRHHAGARADARSLRRRLDRAVRCPPPDRAPEDEVPKKALKLALADTEKSFLALRRREPEEQWQMPCASIMLVAERSMKKPFGIGVSLVWRLRRHRDL